MVQRDVQTVPFQLLPSSKRRRASILSMFVCLPGLAFASSPQERLVGASHERIPLQARPGARERTTVVEPGLPAFTFGEDELFTEIGSIYGEEAPDYHGTAFWYNGHLGIIYAKGMFEGGLSLFDISNPRAPQLVGQGDSPVQREGHTTGFIETDVGILAVSLASNGLNLWDLNDPTDPHVHKNVRIDGIKPIDYDFGAWWVGVQAPYVFLAGSYNGLYVIDLSDLERPRVLNQVRMGSGFRCGSVYTVGNFLVQSSSDGPVSRIYDIGDPANPLLVKEFMQAKDAYATHFNGGYLYTARGGGGIEVLDLNDPTDPFTVATIPLSGGGAYLTVQDEYVHLGNSSQYYKVDLLNPLAPVVVGQSGITTSLPEVDVDFPSHLGNLVVISDDHNLTQFNVGSRLVPHETQPDTLPPEVNFVHPPDGASNIPLTSRFGVTLTDQILVTSAHAASFMLKDPSGAVVPGRTSVQQNIVNFTPAEALLPETSYRLEIPAGGLRDWAGNPTARSFSAEYVTGKRILHPPVANGGADVQAFVGEATTFDASRTTGGLGGLEYSWDPGDSTPASSWSSYATFSHTYLEAGHYSAIVHVVDSQGQTSSDEVRVSVVARPLGEPPTHATSIALDLLQTRLWTVNPDADSVAVVDTVGLSLLEEIPVGHHPTSLALLRDETVWVANQDSSDISVLDASSLRERARIALAPGSRPFGVVEDPSSSLVYVSLEGTGQVLALHSSTYATLWTSSVGPQPRGLTVVGDAIFVSRFLSPGNQGEVVELSRSTGAVRKTWPLVEDPGPDTEISGRGIPNYLTQAVASPDGQRVYLPAFKQNTSRGLTRDGQVPTFENTNRAILAILDRTRGSEALEARLDFDNRDLANAIALSEYGDYGYVSFLGSQNVLIVDLLSGQEVGSILQVGSAPQGLVVSRDGTLYVQNFLSRTVSVYDVSTFFVAESIVRLATIRTVGSEPLPHQVLTGKRIFYNASDTRMSRDSYISCAGCHLDGGSDRRVWDFTDRGEGVRRTTLLRGRGGMIHGPVHWSANFDEIQDFENDIRNAFKGTGMMSDTAWSSGTRSQTLGDPKTGVSIALDALAAYVGSLTVADLSPFRASSGQLTDAARRGRDSFRSTEVGCASCHAGPHFTDSVLTGNPATFVLHDVGTLTAASGKRMGQTLTGLDTPTVKGVWNNAPYLHDGSAPTLRDVLLTRNSQNLHGKTSHLTSSQLDDLEAYLKQIDARSGAPVVTHLEPAVGARVWAPAAVRVSFSSWPDPATVSSTTTRVLKGTSAVAGSLALSRNLITFTPSSPLTSGTYTVQVTTGLKSIDGDVASSWTGSFEVADVALVSGVRSSSSRVYTVKSNLKRGALVYSDADHRLLTLPSKYAGLGFLQTANEDRRETGPALVSFDLAGPATVYVAFDRRLATLPGWAADFAPTGDALTTTEASFLVYAGSFGPGTVILGGSRADGGSGASTYYGDIRQYIVFFQGG